MYIVQPAQDNIPVGIRARDSAIRDYDHADTNAGLDGDLRIRMASDFFFEDTVFWVAFLVFRSWSPICFAIPWFWLAPRNAMAFCHGSIWENWK
jgi:hypothetical protein